MRPGKRRLLNPFIERLAKSTARIVTLFGLANLWMARRRLGARG